jgi:anaerobic selenocysteine-containing dehydrogenase
MQIFRYAEAGSIELLWISATNPAVSLPDLARIRRILTKADLFVVVQDLYLTETAQFADVVLPAATWGEKIGTFTNADRTVHLSEKAVEPPGEARPDLDIFLDFARRMDFRNRVGVRGVEGVLPWSPVRLQRTDLRAATRQWHPVALHRRSARRCGAALP